MKNIFVTLISLTFIFSAPTKKVYEVSGMMCGVGCVNKINTTLKKRIEKSKKGRSKQKKIKQTKLLKTV